RYAMESEIGAGGMATVYLARDLKHERQVAVKVFRPELAAALGSERFLREIKITAGLNHPHILPLLDSGEADSFLFYVMPFVEGESLRDRMDREGELGVEEAVRITAQIARALAYAHAKGIVHRDIKPENVLLQADQVVVADFGIALAVDSAGGDRLTETGLSVGTPAYMSPEQVAGEKELDARSDIYALGCVLYEMLAGDPPFTASNPRAVLAKHLTDPAPPVTTVRPGVTAPVATAIAKALGKAPSDRHRSATEFEEALFAEPGEVKEEKKSIVVLPFENLSADLEQEYFCDGITEEIINALSHVEDLTVIARTSAFAFKGRHKDVREIGRALDVKHLLEGSVRKAGNRLRITAQLIETGDGSHLWSDRFDRDMDDVFALQDEISLAIVDTLKARLLTGEREALTKRHTDNPELHNLYLLARHHWGKFTPEGFDLAEQYLEQAIEKDPEFPLAYAGIAEINHFRPFFAGVRPKESFPKAKEFVQKALAIDPNLADAHAVMGRLHMFYDWDWEAAEREYLLALELNPNSASAHWFYASLLNLSGRHDQAVEEAERARELDPLSILVNAIKGERTFHAGRYEEAVSDLKRTLAMDPGHFYSHLLLGWVYWEMDRREEAISEFETALALSGRSPMVLSGLSNAYWRTGREEESDRLLEELLEKASQEFILPQYVFSVYNVRGDLDRAFEWFDRAVEENDIMLPFSMTWPGEDWALPDDPRFEEALDRLRKR
ncbi:MAG: protein kinase, partial [Gemmatimonadota bacterium]